MLRDLAARLGVEAGRRHETAQHIGFVGAAESKQALVDAPRDLNFVTLRGRRGGSAIAAAAFNAVTGGASDQ